MSRGFLRLGVVMALGLVLALPQASLQAKVNTCGLDAARANEVRLLAQQLVQRGHAPGVVVDIRCAGQPWVQLALGQADRERAVAMKLDHRFRIYSMTKPLTSALAMMLVEEGRLSLDDPLARYLPAFALATAYSGSAVFPPEQVPLLRAVTVRDLLRHTAGLTYLSPLPDPVTRSYVARGIDHGGGPVIKPGDGTAPVASLQELTERLAAVPLMTQPGARFTYGNATDVLGRVLEVASGQTLEALMTARLLQPLGMQNTGFMVGTAHHHQLTAAYMAPSLAGAEGALLRHAAMQQVPASHFTLMDDPQNSVFGKRRPIHFGGAGLVSNAEDYHRFLSLMAQSGTWQGQPLLRQNTVAWMTQNQVEPAALQGTTLERQGLGFGLGFATFQHPERAPVAVPRDGYFWGGAASTYFWVDSASGITGVLMTQVFGGDVAPYFTELLERLYRPKPRVRAAY